MNWLFKTEPSEYSAQDLQKRKVDRWDGVANAMALKHLRTAQAGERVLIYHTGDVRAVVALARVEKSAYPDPAAQDAKLVVVDVRFERMLESMVTLEKIKSDEAFAGWDLLRLGRLSVVPTTDAMFDHVLALAKQGRAK